MMYCPPRFYKLKPPCSSFQQAVSQNECAPRQLQYGEQSPLACTQLPQPTPLKDYADSSKEHLCKDDDNPALQLSKKQHLSISSPEKGQLARGVHGLGCPAKLNNGYLLTAIISHLGVHLRLLRQRESPVKVIKIVSGNHI
ncbi:hypothetical protein NC651_015351 [Populus alba x Populus x berolinensis]|nr:hypothetical protein NC651_015351 [Populus alba x Populus x berolinensis]